MRSPIDQLSRSTDLLLTCAIWCGSLCSQLAAEQVQIEYLPSNEVFANPERGFYVQMTARSPERPLTDQSLQDLRNRNISLILRMYYLKSFRDQPLSNAQLELIKQDFVTLRRNGCKCILRFAYSSRIGEPDAPMKTVLRHIDQLEPLLHQNADVIFVLQTGFIGPWGEMHNSTNGLDTPDSIRLIVARLLKALPSSRSVQVRTPIQKQYCIESDQPLTSTEAFSDSMKSRIGHYNDCFLANETDVGTYETGKVRQQKQYLALDSRFVSMGGETCRTSKLVETSNARREFSRMHWSFLHLNYHPRVIAQWRELHFLEEVSRKLGYRLELVSSTFGSNLLEEDGLTFSLQLKNTGWAAPVNPRDVFIVAKNDSKQLEYRAKLDVNIKSWLPNRPTKLSGVLGVPKEMPFGEYRLYLILPDPEPELTNQPEYAIRLANTGIWDAQQATNDLKHTISVSSWTSATNPNPITFFSRHP